MIKGRKPRILVGVPTYVGKNYCLHEFIEGLWLLNTDGFDVRFLIVDNTMDGGVNAAYIQHYSGIRTEHLDVSSANFVTEKLQMSHEYLRQAALKMKVDYLLHVESDLALQPFTLHYLYLTNKQVVGANYGLNTGAARYPIAHIAQKLLPTHSAGGRIMISPQLLYRAFMKGSVQETSLVGLGTILIHRHVLRDVPFRVETNGDYGCDSYWSVDVFNAGYRIYVNNAVYPFHMSDTGWGSELSFTTEKQSNKITS